MRNFERHPSKNTKYSSSQSAGGIDGQAPSSVDGKNLGFEEQQQAPEGVREGDAPDGCAQGPP
jgi:hypothetical protein